MTQAPDQIKPVSVETGNERPVIVARVYCDHDRFGDHVSLGGRWADGQFADKMAVILVEAQPVLLIHPGTARAYVDPYEVLHLTAVMQMAAYLMIPGGQELRDCLLAPERLAKLAEGFADVEVVES